MDAEADCHDEAWMVAAAGSPPVTAVYDGFGNLVLSSSRGAR
jgi:hypothetical protein